MSLQMSSAQSSAEIADVHVHVHVQVFAELLFLASASDLLGNLHSQIPIYLGQPSGNPVSREGVQNGMNMDSIKINEKEVAP